MTLSLRKISLSLIFALSGCATTVHTDLNSCQQTSVSQFKNVIPNPLNEKDEDGEAPLLQLPDNKIELSRSIGLGFNQACQDARGALRLGLLRNKDGEYDLYAIQVLRTYMARETTSPEVRQQIELRLKQQYKMSLEDLAALENKLRLKILGPTSFVCRDDASGARRCREVPNVPAPAVSAPGS